MRGSLSDRNKGENAMNKKTESKGAPDVRQLRDNELDAIAGGWFVMPGLGTMASNNTGDILGSAIDRLSQDAGLPH
jgi:hypothetical protein